MLSIFPLTDKKEDRDCIQFLPSFFIRSSQKKIVPDIQGRSCRGASPPTKPISRVLSCAEIYLGVSSPKRSSRRDSVPIEQIITHCSKKTLHRVGFTWQQCLHCSGELLPRLSTLAAGRIHVLRRYISVALSLRSPSAAVSSYPAL